MVAHGLATALTALDANVGVAQTLDRASRAQLREEFGAMAEALRLAPEPRSRLTEEVARSLQEFESTHPGVRDSEATDAWHRLEEERLEIDSAETYSWRFPPPPDFE